MFPHHGIKKPFYSWPAQHMASNLEAVRPGHFPSGVGPYSKWDLIGATVTPWREAEEPLLRLLSFNFLICSLLQGEISIVLWRAASGWGSIFQAFLERGMAIELSALDGRFLEAPHLNLWDSGPWCWGLEFLVRRWWIWVEVGKVCLVWSE